MQCGANIPQPYIEAPQCACRNERNNSECDNPRSLIGYASDYEPKCDCGVEAFGPDLIANDYYSRFFYPVRAFSTLLLDYRTELCEVSPAAGQFPYFQPGQQNVGVHAYRYRFAFRID